MAAGACRAPSSTARSSTLVDSWNGKRLNSPNDVVVKSDGTVWFTDPPYGILTDLEGWQGEHEYGACHVFCFDPASGELRVVADDFVKPNGIAFSPDEKILYIADTGASHEPDGPRHIRAFDVTDKGKLKKSRVFATCDAGLFDGFRLDTAGRVWTSRRRRRALLRPQRRPARQDPGARGGEQRLLRRPEEEPPLHLRHDQPLRRADACERGAEAVAETPSLAATQLIVIC